MKTGNAGAVRVEKRPIQSTSYSHLLVKLSMTAAYVNRVCQYLSTSPKNGKSTGYQEDQRKIHFRGVIGKA